VGEVAGEAHEAAELEGYLEERLVARERVQHEAGRAVRLEPADELPLGVVSPLLAPNV